MSQRKDGRFVKKLYIGTVDGKKQYQFFYGKTQKEADDKATLAKAQLLKGLNLLSDDRLRIWIDSYLDIKKSACSDSQIRLIKSRLDYFADWNGRDWDGGFALGDFKLSEVQPSHLQSVINALARCNPHTGRPSAKNTLKPIKEAIYAVFDNAVFNRAIDFNPAARLTIPKTAPHSDRRALTVEERQRIIETDHRARLPALLMMLCGLRRGEVTALTWRDVDLDRRIITVSKSYDFKQCELKRPKTESGIRTVPIPSMMVDILNAARSDSPYVVVSGSGTRMTETAWKRLLESYLCDLNAAAVGASKFSPTKLPILIEPFTWHCLRHTYATILFEADIDALTAKELLGHSDIKTTLNIYTHLQDERRAKQAEKLDSFLLGESKGESINATKP